RRVVRERREGWNERPTGVAGPLRLAARPGLEELELHLAPVRRRRGVIEPHRPSNLADAQAAEGGDVDLDCGLAEAEHPAEPGGRAGLAAIWRTMNGESLVHVIERILGPLVDAAGAQGAFHAVGHERDRAIADGDTGKWREGQRHGTLRCD